MQHSNEDARKALIKGKMHSYALFRCRMQQKDAIINNIIKSDVVNLKLKVQREDARIIKLYSSMYNYNIIYMHNCISVSQQWYCHNA